MLFFSGFWALSADQDIFVKDKVQSLNSYKAYLNFEKEKKIFNKNREYFLKQRKKYLQKKDKTKANQNKAYVLDFLTNIQPQGNKKKSFLSKKTSIQERAFLDHQKKQQAISKQRTKDFFSYKKKYRNYQKKQQETLDLRLKAISSLRDTKDSNKIPVF